MSKMRSKAILKLVIIFTTYTFAVYILYLLKKEGNDKPSHSASEQPVSSWKANAPKPTRTKDFTKHLEKNNRKFVCVQFLAGTGNRIFQFVTAYVMARAKNMTLVLPGRLKRFSEAFVSPNDVSHNMSECDKLPAVTHVGIGTYDRAIFNKVSGNQSVHLYGYFQSFKFFKQFTHFVKQGLVFREDVMEQAKRTLQGLYQDKYGTILNVSDNSEVREKNLTLIGVHVRRGDKTDNTQVKAGYRVAPLDYITKAVSVMKSRYPTATFFVVSDDIEWCIRHLSNTRDMSFITNLGWTPSLALLTLMDHTIMTVGTFGWWGAWLAGGDVIYYRDFLTPGSKMDRNFRSSDFFPPEWQGLG